MITDAIYYLKILNQHCVKPDLFATTGDQTMSLLQEIEQHGLADCEYNRKLLADQTMQQIATYPNEKYGIESRIYQTGKGFNVALFDTDAKQRVCLFIRFQTLAQAVVKAKHLADIN